jgi:hypothetical protein
MTRRGGSKKHVIAGLVRGGTKKRPVENHGPFSQENLIIVW